MRVLCVAPRFAPSNAADSHRLRLLLAHATVAGWQAEVLAVHPDAVPVPCDATLLAGLPAAVPVHRVRPERSLFPFRSLALRAWGSLRQAGDALLASGRFDLVFFSSTEFLLHGLGPYWQRRHGVPFCMDYQDPWVSDYYREHPAVTPPGGRLKYAVMSRLDRWMEARVAPACSGFIAVSAAYLDDLARRYGPALASRPSLVRSFPAEPAELAGLTGVAQEPSVWRYVGRGGEDMHHAVTGFLRAWREAGSRCVPEVRFEALGTSYADPARSRQSLQALARNEGMADRFREQPARVAYGDMLRLLTASGALVVFGSDDPAYTASKIYPYLLARRPLLVICHEDSGLVALLRKVGGATCVTFRPDQPVTVLAAAIGAHWFASGAWREPQPLDMEAFAPFTASVQAREVGRWFADCLGPTGRGAS